MSRPSRARPAAESPFPSPVDERVTLAQHVEQLARSLDAGRFAAVAKRAEWVVVEAGRGGAGPVVRYAALLLAAAERQDAAAAVSALVRLADTLDRQPPARRAA